MSTATTAPQVDLLTTQQNFYDPILHCSPPAFNTGMSPNFYGVRIVQEAKKRTLKNMLPKSPTDPIKVGQDYRS